MSGFRSQLRQRRWPETLPSRAREPAPGRHGKVTPTAARSLAEKFADQIEVYLSGRR
jgi:hypothetical protein